MSVLSHMLSRTLPRVRILRLRYLPRRDWLLAFLVAASLGLMVRGYLASQREVVLQVDGQARVVRTHHGSVAGILRQAGVSLQPGDRVVPPPEEEVPAGGVMRVERARHVMVWAEGRPRETWTHAATAGEALTALEVRLKPGDSLLLEGRPVGQAAPLPQSGNGPIHLSVVRSVELQVSDGPTPLALATTARTVGEALLASDIDLYPEDRVLPALSTPIQPGLRVHIRRAKPVTVEVDDKVIEERTHLRVVGELLGSLGVKMGPKDYTNVPLEASLTSGLRIEVTRVNEVTVQDSQALAFETLWQPDPTQELDQTRLIQPGANGVFTREWLERYENGELMDRTLTREWVEREPVPEIYGYGTSVVTRALQTPQGTVEYWRAIEMRATSYTAATSGKSQDHPAYGVTRSGLPAGRGVVAVDPRVIPLGTRLYIPGYGVAVAGDTGGRILGRRVDLGYGEDNLVLWNRRVMIYLLPPAPESIRYILPQEVP